MSRLKSLVKHCIPQRHEQMIRAISLLGFKVHCPCCGWFFREFLPRPRVNSQCPRCGSLERHRLLWLYLRHRTTLFFQRLTLLHIAPEPSHVAALRRMRNLRYITADLVSPGAQLRMDLMNIPIRDNSVDAIICIHVLEHVADDKRAMRELYRVLRPGGWAILQVPLDSSRMVTHEDPLIVSPEQREREFGQADHVRQYGTDYPTRLSDAGFRVVADPYVRTLSDRKVQRYRLGINEDIYHCTKP